MGIDVRVSRRTLDDAGDAFYVTMVEPPNPERVVLFSVGAGGDPDRHIPFLRSVAARGCTIMAPHFARLSSVAPTGTELALRARRLRMTLDYVPRAETTVAAIGHSIGATVLLALAGAEVWTLAGETLRLPPDRRITRLALMAPATDFFRAPGALEGVRAKTAIWVGSIDEITPPTQAELLRRAMPKMAAVDMTVVAGAGHFSFMSMPPPHASEPLSDRDAFLDRLAVEMGRLIIN